MGIHKVFVHSMSQADNGTYAVTFVNGDENIHEAFTKRQWQKLCVMAGSDDPIGKRVGICMDAAGDIVDICRENEFNLKRPLWERQHGN